MKRIFLAAAMALMVTSAANAVITKDFYAATSVLSSGKWVRIGVEKTGVYEISYDMLREMGFSNPSKVSVYGKGGWVMPQSFTTNAGVPIITDDLAPVKVLHEGNMLYFYGLGPEEISFQTDSNYSLGGYFSRQSNNIYSRRGYYFLTDSRDVNPMTEKNYDSSTALPVNSGVSYLYHELDSVQNDTRTGQLFWGESFNLPGATRRYWEVTLPDATGSKGVMQCEVYLAAYNEGDVVFGVLENKGDKNYFSVHNQENGPLYYSPQEQTVAEITIPGDRGIAMAGVDNPDDMRAFSNLDFWVVSYERTMPTMKDADGRTLNQQLLALPEVPKNATRQLQLENSASLIVLDVTNVRDPQRLKMTQRGAYGTVGVRNTGNSPVVVVFDKEQPQLQISGYETDYSMIENQDLHAYRDKGADFIIIVVPEFLFYAQEIARLHEEKDGIKVVVATTEQCYNEFSGGTPDPMAYRSLARMLYESPRKPKNILLMGPLWGDVRGLQSERDPFGGIIAYQSPVVSVERGAHNINDFYGMMEDRFRDDYFERNKVHMGVGILPVRFESEAAIVTDKIRRYLDRDDHAYYMNLFTGVSGLYDSHTHDIQVRDIQSHIRNVDNLSTVFTPLPIDSYGNAEARKKFLNQINSGCNMFSYFGHGAEQFLGKNKYFFNAGDVASLRNQVLTFAHFGGCQITNTDRGFRGLGESIVTSTPYGCIGSIVSARDTWSGQNYEFFKQFFTCFYTSGSTVSAPRRTTPVTIGEVYASVKDISTYSNELAYQLLCDPALVIPTINRSVKVTVSMPDGGNAMLRPGEINTFVGSILNFDGTPDNSFNGQIVLRINNPEKTIAAGAIETGEDPKSLAFTYRDDQMAIFVADVKNGQFEIKGNVPSAMGTFAGETGLLYFCAYDPTTRMGAGRSFSITIGGEAAGSAESSDKIAPVIEQLEFNSEQSTISFSVSDNFALNMSSNPLSKGLYLYIDGTEYPQAHFVQPVVETSRPAYSKTVGIDALTYGEHTARLKVKDAAGNVAEQEITFTYQPLQAKYSLSRDNENSNPSVTIINVEGIAPAHSTLVVLAASGEVVYRQDFTGNTVKWNHEGVSPGHYKAYIIETGTSAMKGHSDPIDVPVI